MLRKKLVVSGDSYTAGWRPGDDSDDQIDEGAGSPTERPIGPLWPEYLGEMLDMDVINVSISGRGNEFIYNSIIDKLASSKDVGLSIAMWNFPGKIVKNQHDHVDEPGRRVPPVSELMNTFPGQRNERRSIEYYFLKSLRWFNAFQNYCDSNKIPYMQCSAFNTVSNDLVFLMSNHPVFYKMKEDHFYGWPMFQQIGGFNISDKLNEVDPEMKELRVSDTDTHPNTDGHKLMAELLYNHYVSIDA
jgi:hypothetical protein